MPTALAASMRLIFLELLRLRWSSLHFLTISMTQKITLSLLLSFFTEDDSLNFSASWESDPEWLVRLCISVASLTRIRSQPLAVIQQRGILVQGWTTLQRFLWKSQIRMILSEMSMRMLLKASKMSTQLSITCSCTRATEVFSSISFQTTKVLTILQGPYSSYMLLDYYPIISQIDQCRNSQNLATAHRLAALPAAGDAQK